MGTQAFLSAYSEVIESSSPSDVGLFGEVDMSYDEMYQSLYMVGEPVMLSDLIASMADQEYQKLDLHERHGAFQCLYYDALEEMCEELCLDYNEVSVDISGHDLELIYLVNYKGEGEGWFSYKEVKSKIAGKYVSKYNYA